MATWRYIVGKSLSKVGNAVLSSQAMLLTRAIPLGISYPYDIKRFAPGYLVKTIFDVGANIGQTSLFLKNHFPQAEIFAFEPVKETYETLKSNARTAPNIKPVRCALGDETGQKVISIREDSELNTLVDCSDRDVAMIEKTEEITVTTLDSFCKEAGISKINLLKMDVQGYELQVLQGADYFIRNGLIDFIYAEVGFAQHNPECQYFHSLNTFLETANFQFSGFYEIFRWGNRKQYFGFCNALFVNRNLERG